MALLDIHAGATSRAIPLFITTSGLPLPTLAFNTAGLTGWWKKSGDATATQFALVTATPGTYTSQGFVAMDATNLKGWYELGIPTTGLSAGTWIVGELSGAAGMDPCPFMVQVTAVDNQNANTFGIGVLTGQLQKNTAYAAFKFYLRLASDHVSPATGKTVTGQTAIDGAAFTALTNAVTEVSAGWYTVNLAAADLNGTDVALLFTATGCDPVPIKVIL